MTLHATIEDASAEWMARSKRVICVLVFVCDGVPHGGQVSHGHVQGLHRVQRDLQTSADQRLLQQPPRHLGQPVNGHFKDAILPLAGDGHLEINLHQTRGPE